MKRAIPLLFAVAILFTIAPVAMADHCYGCRSRPFQQGEPANCQFRPNHGFANCTVDVANDTCILTNACGDHASLVTPLAAEFQVASVERLDEPQTAASDTLIATVQAAQTTIR